MPGTLLSAAYPDAAQWRELVKQFSDDAIAHKLLLAHIPYVFRNEPVKFAVFRRILADSFGVHPTDVFIVGSAMAGRSLVGKNIEQAYSSSSDIDTLIVSESLFTSLLMQSLEWVNAITESKKGSDDRFLAIQLDVDDVCCLNKLAANACRGIWRPDSLPKRVPAREEFFARLNRVSLHTLGLQLSDGTVAKVTGRVARSFESAVADLAHNICRLKREFKKLETAQANDANAKQLGTSQAHSKPGLLGRESVPPGNGPPRTARSSTAADG
jgi:hypothetical protein